MTDDSAASVEAPLEEPRWHVAIGGEVYGPADREELAKWAAEGRLVPGSQVVPVGGDRWTPVHLAPGLKDLVLTPPPPPSPTAYAYPAARQPVAERRLSDCPHCAGPVTNIAPSYGFPWGFFQRALRPRFRCGQCGRAIAYDELSAAAQGEVSRALRRATIGWFSLVIGLILFIALCVIVPLASVR
jgi:hypothetical protein